MKGKTIVLKVNGIDRQVEVGPDTTLLRVLRDELRLTGTKEGCGQGHCGACTVIVNGRAVRACVTKAARLDGARVETIEGLARDGELHPLQRAFIAQGAVQCGFCTPGMIMAAKALLDANPQPTRGEVVKALQPNLCRCTGYASIVRAIEQAARELQGEEPPSPPIPPTKPPLRVVGHAMPRPDARAKATGEAIYAADLCFDDMLHAKVLRSRYPHARVLRVEASRARGLLGVAAVLTAEDIPGTHYHGLVRPDWLVLVRVGEEVRYMGDAIALVAAEREEIAREALGLIEVEYEPLPGVFSPQEALAPGAPLVHKGGNLLKHIKVRKGNVERGFAEAEVIVRGEYRTPTVEHAFLEPEAGVAVPDPEGSITVYVGSQIPFEDRRQVAQALALPEEKVRIVQTTVGGAFGGKEDIATQIHVALLAQATGRPVKLVYTREESIVAHPKRHATAIRLRMGATEKGKLTALEATIYGDAGAYASLSEHVMTRTATHAAGPYEVPHVQVDCYAAYTNNTPAGAMRGFGVPQAAFAIESLIDTLAERLGLHPLELRRRNALRIGAVTATGQVLRESVGLLETIDQVEKAFRSAQEALGESPSPSTKRRGWGFACCFKNVGLGGGAPDSAGAEVELTEDGRGLVRIGAAEVGQGLVGVVAQIACEELGVPYERIELLVGDTTRTLDGGPTTASRQAYITGNAVRLAARELREALARLVAEELDAPPERLAFASGRVYDEARPERAVFLERAIALARKEGRPLVASHVYTPPPTVPLGEKGDMHFTYGYATQAALVEVDIETGQVEVLKVIAAHDVGRAINPQAILGQLEGGVMMGLGFALSEELQIKEGITENPDLARYRVPRIRHMPQVIPIFVEAETEEGPYGAKGVGEITSIPTAPAIINAIYAACGARITSLPATPEKVLEALKG